MNVLIDKCILFLYGMLSLLFLEFNDRFIVACFLALIISCFIYSVSEKKAGHRTFLPLLPVSVLSTFVPELCLFLPLISYDYGREKKYLVVWGISILGIFLAFPQSPLAFYPLFGCGLSFLLNYRRETYLSLEQRYRKTRDDDTELQLLLKERNQTLLEKQNSEIYAATLRERNRIAREIHDNVGHMLTRAILMVGALRAIYREHRLPDFHPNMTDSSQDQTPLAQSLSQLNDTLNQAMDSIRQSVHDLHDSSINLQESLETLIRDFTFCPVKLHYEMSLELPRELKYSLISIAKEGLVNISKHSDATAASLVVLEHPAFYQFILEDNGHPLSSANMSGNNTLTQNSPEKERGCDTNHLYHNGIGLTNMQNRVTSLQGTMQIRTEKGFCIHITIPKT